MLQHYSNLKPNGPKRKQKKMGVGVVFLSTISSITDRSVVIPASLVLNSPRSYFSSTGTTTQSCNKSIRATPKESASISSMASSEQARVSPAIQSPIPPITKFMIGLCQLKVTAEKERNIMHAQSVVEEAAEKGAKLVVLPEIWNSLYSNDSFTIYAENIDSGFDASPSTVMLSQAAKKLNITIVGGSIPERSGDKLYNTCCDFGPDGELKAIHQKRLAGLGLASAMTLDFRNWRCFMLQEVLI